MIEFAISLRIGRADTLEKVRGEILCVKLSPAVWGSAERKSCLIVRTPTTGHAVLEAIENRLLALQAGGETFPVLFPPQRWAVDADGNRRFLQRSKFVANLSQLTVAQQNALSDPATTKPVVTITLAKLAQLFGLRTGPTLSQGETLEETG